MTQNLTYMTLVAVVLTAAVAGVVLPTERKKAALAFLLGWLVPGLGHLSLGKWKKAIFFFVALGALYVAGLWLTGFRTVGFDDNPFYFVGQYGSGMTTALGYLLGGHRAFLGASAPLEEKAFPRADLSLGLYDPGLLYVCVAGLLNLVVALNCFDGRALAQPKAAEKKEEAAA